jgi:hypothetical protein
VRNVAHRGSFCPGAAVRHGTWNATSEGRDAAEGRNADTIASIHSSRTRKYLYGNIVDAFRQEPGDNLTRPPVLSESTDSLAFQKKEFLEATRSAPGVLGRDTARLEAVPSDCQRVIRASAMHDSGVLESMLAYLPAVPWQTRREHDGASRRIWRSEELKR